MAAANNTTRNESNNNANQMAERMDRLEQMMADIRLTLLERQLADIQLTIHNLAPFHQQVLSINRTPAPLELPPSPAHPNLPHYTPASTPNFIPATPSVDQQDTSNHSTPFHHVPLPPPFKPNLPTPRAASIDIPFLVRNTLNIAPIPTQQGPVGAHIQPVAPAAPPHLNPTPSEDGSSIGKDHQQLHENDQQQLHENDHSIESPKAVPHKAVSKDNEDAHISAAHMNADEPPLLNEGANRRMYVSEKANDGPATFDSQPMPPHSYVPEEMAKAETVPPEPPPYPMNNSRTSFLEDGVNDAGTLWKRGSHAWKDEEFIAAQV